MVGSVKDLIEELKNLSELMLDLAYSSVMFENKDIAKEVMLLYDRLVELEEHLYLHLFAASRGKDAKKLISIIDIVESSKLVASAAKNMGNLVLEGSGLHPIIKDAIKESDNTIEKLTLDKNSILSNKKIGEMRIRSETGADIVAIRRGNNWNFDPKKDTLLMKDDVLICVGHPTSCHKLRKVASGEVHRL